MDGAPRDCFTINIDCCFESQFCHVLEIEKKKDLKAKFHFQNDSVSSSAEPFPHKNKQSGKTINKNPNNSQSLEIVIRTYNK